MCRNLPSLSILQQQNHLSSIESLALLKAKLLAEGICLSDSVSSNIFINSVFYSVVTAGVELELSNGLTANARINPDAEVCLFKKENTLALSFAGEFLPVKVINHSEALSEYLPDTAIPVFDYCFIATDRINVWAIENCAMSVRNTPCHFCDVAFDTSPYRLQRTDHIHNAVALLLKKKVPAKHIQITGGTPLSSDWDHFFKVCETAMQFGLPVSAMLTPLAPFDCFLKLRDLGITELSVNIELASVEARRKFTPGKQECTWKRLAEISALWPEHSVRSALIVGLEPEEETMTGVCKMLECGIIPVLSPFRPAQNIPLSHVTAPTSDLLYRIFMRSIDKAVKHNSFIGPKCTACQHNVMAVPIEMQFIN